jgi:hypothetical protein
VIDLELSLSELAERLEIPGGDWLAADVVRRIDTPERRHARLRTMSVAGAMAVVILAVVVALPGPRRAVARWLGFDSVRIDPGVTVPTTGPASGSTTGPATTVVAATSSVVATTQPVIDLDLGPAVSINEAISQTGLVAPMPALLGEPQSIHVLQPPDAGQIVVVYAASDLVPQSTITGVGALVSAIPANLEEGLFRKALGDEATVRFVDVGGAEGFWIEGSAHQLFFEVDDEVLLDTLRLATNTLLWQRGGQVFRLEADISLDTALRIAASVP